MPLMGEKKSQLGQLKRAKLKPVQRFRSKSVIEFVSYQSTGSPSLYRTPDLHKLSLFCRTCLERGSDTALVSLITG